MMERFAIETKVKEGYEAAGVIFSTVDCIARKPFREDAGASPPDRIAHTMYGYLILIK